MQTNLSETEVSFQNTVTVAFTLSLATLRVESISSSLP